MSGVYAACMQVYDVRGRLLRTCRHDFLTKITASRRTPVVIMVNGELWLYRSLSTQPYALMKYS